MRRVMMTFGVLLGVALLVGACSSTPTEIPTTIPEPDDAPLTSPLGNAYQLLIAASDVAVGESRFAFVVLDPQGNFVEEDRISVDFLRVTGENTFDTVVEGLIAIYRVLEVEEPHQHADGTLHVHLEARGVYVVNDAPLDTVGSWIVRTLVPDAAGGGDSMEIGAIFDVRETGFTPAIGAPAPRSDNLTASDVDDLTQISTREPPGPALYEMTIAEAIDAPRPILVAFSTPAFCQSRICGPVLEGVVQDMPGYAGRISFIHVEPFELDALRNGDGFQLVPAAVEWNLPSEPWIFIIDAQGLVAAKFEGIVTPDELSDALDAVLAR